MLCTRTAACSQGLVYAWGYAKSSDVLPHMLRDPQPLVLSGLAESKSVLYGVSCVKVYAFDAGGCKGMTCHGKVLPRANEGLCVLYTQVGGCVLCMCTQVGAKGFHNKEMPSHPTGQCPPVSAHTPLCIAHLPLRPV